MNTYDTRHKLFSLFARSIACSRALEKNPVKSRANISNDHTRLYVRMYIHTILVYVRTYAILNDTYICSQTE